MNTNPRQSGRFSSLEDWLDWLETLHPKKIDLSLGRVKTVLSALRLERPPYRVITIAGTNGKGSCVAILESIYLEAGYRTGAFTSPHLWRFNERLRVDGSEATDAELIDVFRAIEAVRGDVTLSYFEYSAVAAVVWFTRQQVQVALLEVGLGGRLDAVNALDPDASMIVSIDLDHQAWLGETRGAVALEKAGILRQGRPAIVADRDPPECLLEYARNLGTSLRVSGRDFDHDDESAARWRFQNASGNSFLLPVPSFGGRVQLGNAAACAAVIESLEPDLPVTASALSRGIARAHLHARFECRSLDGVEWILDVAHNPEAARVLAEELVAAPRPGRTIAVFAAMADKDIPGVVEPFVDFVEEWIVIRADSERGAPENSLMEVLRDGRTAHARAASGVVEACRDARNLARDGDRVVVFGSCYIVGPAMTALGLYCAPSPADDRSSRWTGV